MFGPRGSGADVVAEGLGGRIGDFHGRILCNGKELAPFKTPARRSELESDTSPERKRDGLLMNRTIQENLSLLEMRNSLRLGFMNSLAEREDGRTVA